MLLAVLAAGGAAASFAVATSVQHRAAAQEASVHGASAVWRVVGRPAWWFGQAAAGAGLVLHSLALAGGDLALVQPLMVSGLVLAIPVRAVLERAKPDRRDVAWAAVVATGLAALLVGAAPRSRGAVASPACTAVVVGLGGLLAATACLAGRRSNSPSLRGMWWGAGSGIFLGLSAGAMKLTALGLGRGLGPALTSWPVWSVVVLGLLGSAASQRAYQVAPLPASLPALNTADPLVAIAFGCIVLGDRLNIASTSLVADACGIALIAVGVRALNQTPRRGSPTRGADPSPHGRARTRSRCGPPRTDAGRAAP